MKVDAVNVLCAMPVTQQVIGAVCIVGSVVAAIQLLACRIFKVETDTEGKDVAKLFGIGVVTMVPVIGTILHIWLMTLDPKTA